MHLFLLFTTLSHAARLSFCSQDMSEVQLARSGPFMPPEHLMERSLQPALLRFQQDICRCLPKRPRRWPAEIRARLRVAPNQGETTLSYLIAPPWSRSKTRLVECLGEPTVTYEPFHYLSDIITEDGREEAVLDFPLVLEL